MNREGSLFFNFSNDLDSLFDTFSSKLRQARPLHKQWVVVPGFAVKNSLEIKVAKNLGISMGLEFLSLQPLIHKMIQLLFPGVRTSTHLDLALKIEIKIKKMIEEGEIYSEKFRPLLNYLKSNKGDFQPLKLTTLCDHLASLFVKYALYCPNLSDSWKKDLKDHWQKALWETVFDKEDYYYNPSQILKMDLMPLENLPILYIFNLSFIPKPYFQFLIHISQKVRIEVFQLSPCCYFWSDIKSDFEKSATLSYLRKKKVSDSKVLDLQGYLSDSNTLLANYGKLGREWIKLVELEERVLSKEKYFAPLESLKYTPYPNWIDSSEIAFNERPMTLLSALQTDLLLMPSQEQTTSLFRDRSLEIHQASTYQREVEILYYNLIELLENNRQLKPSDISVYTPHIENYIPYIQNIFKGEENKIEFSIYNYPFKSHNKVLKGLLLLVDLVECRWDQSRILELFYQPGFKNHFGLTNEILGEWKNWIEEVGVSFGYDGNEQKKAFASEYLDEMQGKEFLPSWKDLFQSILKYLCQKQEKFETLEHLNQIDFSVTDSLNQLIEIIHSLRSDLKILEEKLMTFSSWASYLRCLIESYFLFENADVIELNKIMDKIESYRFQSIKVKEEKFLFKTFFYYLKKELADLQTQGNTSQFQSVSFYSLAHSPSIDSKVIYIMGLNDLEFPHLKVESPLSVMDHFSNTDYCPASIEYDRYLFLEILLAAKEHLFLSYLGYSSETFKETQPSILISELLSYLDKRFLLDGQKPSTLLIKKHPHLSFSHEYFNKKNYHVKSYPLAESYYYPKPTFKEGLRDGFLEGKKIASSLECSNNLKLISLKDLCALARNSIQFSLNKVHQVFLERESISHNNQNFFISNLQRAIFKKGLLKNGRMPQYEGFPKGVFKKIAKDLVEGEVKELCHFLQENQINPEDVFTVELREDVFKSEEIKKNHWIAPSIKIKLSPFQEVQIIGCLEDVSTKGLITHKNQNKETLFLEWPRYLIYNHLESLLPMGFEKKIIFTKAKKIKSFYIDEPHELLIQYLQFYRLSLNNILPFLPGWISYFMEENIAEISRKIKSDIDSTYFYNEYARMLIGKNFLKEPTLNIWKNLCQNMFKEIYPLVDQ